MHQLLLFVFCLLHQLILTGECNMGPLTSFYECVYYCTNKYGQDPSTQRMFYNRQTGMCEKQVDCGEDGFHRIYQNRCLRQFQHTQIDEMMVLIPEDFYVVDAIYMHGNPNTINPQKSCYPGYKSSYRKVQISKQVYQQYRCDIKIGQDPQNYPQSHGQYFFWRISQSLQAQAVKNTLNNQSIFTIELYILGTLQILFVCALLHKHCCHKHCCHKSHKKKNIKKSTINI